MRRRLFTLGAVGFLAAAALLGSAARGSDEQAKKPIVIGAAISLTSFIAPFDLPAVRFLQYKVDEINASGGLLGGRKIRIIKSDAKSDIQQGAVAGQEVLEKGADFVFVTCDYDFGQAAARVANGKRKIAFSPCAASPKFGVQGIGPYAFTMAYGTPTEGAAMAEWAYKSKKWRSAYILTDDTIEYSRTQCEYFKERWQQLGGTSVVGEDTFKNADPSIASQITRLKSVSKAPQFIAFCSFLPGAASAIKQIRAAGVNTPLLSGQSVDGDFWLSAVPNLSNLFFATYVSEFGDDPSRKVNRLMARYRKDTGERVNQSQAITGYSVMEALAIAITKAGSTNSTAVKAQLEKFRKVPLLVGPTTFSPKLHINLYRAVTIMKVQRGKVSFVTRFTPKKVPKPKF